MLKNMEKLEEDILFEDHAILLLLVGVFCQAALERPILNLGDYVVRLQLKSIGVSISTRVLEHQRC
jgi:hypothetical protein